MTIDDSESAAYIGLRCTQPDCPRIGELAFDDPTREWVCPPGHVHIDQPRAEPLRAANEMVAPPRAQPERVTVLASGGNTVYVFDAKDSAVVDQMEAVLDVAYPGVEVVRQNVAYDRWSVARDELIRQGVEVVDRTVKDGDPPEQEAI